MQECKRRHGNINNSACSLTVEDGQHQCRHPPFCLSGAVGGRKIGEARRTDLESPSWASTISATCAQAGLLSLRLVNFMSVHCTTAVRLDRSSALFSADRPRFGIAQRQSDFPPGLAAASTAVCSQGATFTPNNPRCRMQSKRLLPRFLCRLNRRHQKPRRFSGELARGGAWRQMPI